MIKTRYTAAMSKTKHSNAPLSIAEKLRREFVVRFLAELMQITGPPDKQEHFQAALQKYCDDLRPWLEPSDCPPNPRAAFSLLEGYTFDESGEDITVVLSSEAEPFFRAWLRRNKIWSDAGLNTAHAWSN